MHLRRLALFYVFQLALTRNKTLLVRLKKPQRAFKLQTVRALVSELIGYTLRFAKKILQFEGTLAWWSLAFFWRSTDHALVSVLMWVLPNSHLATYVNHSFPWYSILLAKPHSLLHSYLLGEHTPYVKALTCSLLMFKTVHNFSLTVLILKFQVALLYGESTCVPCNSSYMLVCIGPKINKTCDIWHCWQPKGDRQKH